jgi:putative sugar O-methyltransferase
MSLLRIVHRRLARRVEISRIIRRGRRRFSRDDRFSLHLVEQGFVPRRANTADSSILLRRICDSWFKATKRQTFAAETFQPHWWWRVTQEANLERFTRALAARDFESLEGIYSNFFRDRCSAGLCGLPLSRWIYGNSEISKSSKQLYLIDELHRLDLWKTRTAGRFQLADLEAPDIGNPFGVVLDGVFVRNGSEDQHYCAQRIIDLLGSSERPVVAEIGGGFGGMAYYLIRDRPGVTYLNFDLPDTIALGSYYLLSAFPDVRATLYGEAELSAETLRGSRIILMPAFALPEMPSDSVDVAFNARVLADLSLASLHHYLGDIARTTRGHLLHLNRVQGCLAADAWFATNAPYFTLVEKRPSEWNNARTLRPNEMEYLYERRSAA